MVDALATALPASVAFVQGVPGLVSKGALKEPGRQNYWDLNHGFGLTDGGDDQFDLAMRLRVQVGGASAYFPSDQTYAELTALGPEMGAGDGVRGVSFLSTADFQPLLAGVAGHYGVLHSGPEVRLQTTLNLAAATGGIALTWCGAPSVGALAFVTLVDTAQYRQVVVRDTDGTLLTTLYRQDDNGETGTWGTGSLSAFAGRTVVLSFEQRASSGAMVVEGVAAVDAAGMPFVVNGNFEAGDAGWRVLQSRMSCNVRSGVRTILGLDVRRTFYTQPKLLWGRFTEEFHNPGAAPVDAVVTVESNMGSDNSSFFYPTPGATQSALSVWDSYYDSDVGLVFGAASNVRYRSATGLRMRDGFKDVSWTFPIRVPAGGTVTLVNFVVLGTEESGRGSTSIAQRAPQIDAVAAGIANDFRSDPVYQRGLTPLQLESLQNF